VTATQTTGGISGITEREAAARLLAEGRNEVPSGQRLSLPRAIWHQLTDTVILVLIAAAGLTAAVGDGTDTAVVALNTALGAGQEVRSGHALAALAALVAPRATVVRDGRPREISAAEVVRGDRVRLAAGDIVPADATLVSAESLQVDESTLTGESIAIDKGTGDRLYAGTVITRGRCDGLVDATAGATAVGAIARSLDNPSGGPTPVQRQLSVLGRRLAAGAAVIAVVVAVLNLDAGRGAETSVVLAISIAVAAIPESLPAVVSLSLAMAARRMSAHGVLIRRLAAVEALGSVTVLAADKTGTLTQGRVSVEEVWTPSGTDEARRRLLQAGALCNDAYASDTGRPGHRDDPIEVALVDAAKRAGIGVGSLRAAWPRTREVPFDAAIAQMATTHTGPAGQVIEICKGSPDTLLDAGSNPARSAAERLATDGYRALAVTQAADDSIELLGLVGFRDPPRADAGRVVAAFQRAGVRTVMITGDHPATAAAVASAVGIAEDGHGPAVYARVRPREKAAIVAQLHDAGELVAMTGDGVNDAPALRAADVGVSMGERATEVARQAADMVLTRDDLSVMIPAIAEGRRAYDNLRRFLHYALSGGLAEVLVVLVGTLASSAVPLQAGQLLWVNLLTHGLPGVAMGNEGAAADVLDRPPRSPRARLLDRGMAWRVAVLATVISLACLAADLYALYANRPWQSAIFVTLAFAQLFTALSLKPKGMHVNPMLAAAVSLNLALTVLAVRWEPLQDLLRTRGLTGSDLVICAAAAVIPALVAFAQRRG
jgi:Ca2+-transporting ATPase